MPGPDFEFFAKMSNAQLEEAEHAARFSTEERAIASSILLRRASAEQIRRDVEKRDALGAIPAGLKKKWYENPLVTFALGIAGTIITSALLRYFGLTSCP